MIDFYKFITLGIGLIVILNAELINGENKFRKSYVSKFKSISMKPNYDFESGDLTPEVAETRAQHSVVSSGHDLSGAAGHGYFQYAKVPHKGQWEFGYKRGNPHHFREQHEQGNKHQFKTKLKWGDGHGGYGEHYWDYNHAPKHGGHGKGFGGGGGGSGGGGGGNGR